ncbi:MAG: hypothetical protein IKN43_06670, partial [Selenomonadaceae bacterium]|nr:hypothetical protein [Selenomonadaceae bacterium]
SFFFVKKKEKKERSKEKRERKNFNKINKKGKTNNIRTRERGRMPFGGCRAAPCRVWAEPSKKTRPNGR